jgi:hypothetical protein
VDPKLREEIREELRLGEHTSKTETVLAYRLGVLETEVDSMKRERKKALHAGLVALGTAVLSLASYIFVSLHGRV